MSLDFPTMRVPDRTDHLQSCIAHRSSNRDSLVERLKQEISDLNRIYSVVEGKGVVAK